MIVDCPINMELMIVDCLELILLADVVGLAETDLRNL